MFVQVRSRTEAIAGTGGIGWVDLDIVHRAGGLFAARFIATGRAELVFGFGVLAGLVHGFFTSIFGYVLCPRS